MQEGYFKLKRHGKVQLPCLQQNRDSKVHSLQENSCKIYL